MIKNTIISKIKKSKSTQLEKSETNVTEPTTANFQDKIKEHSPTGRGIFKNELAFNRVVSAIYQSILPTSVFYKTNDGRLSKVDREILSKILDEHNKVFVELKEFIKEEATNSLKSEWGLTTMRLSLEKLTEIAQNSNSNLFKSIMEQCGLSKNNPYHETPDLNKSEKIVEDILTHASNNAKEQSVSTEIISKQNKNASNEPLFEQYTKNATALINYLCPFVEMSNIMPIICEDEKTKSPFVKIQIQPRTQDIVADFKLNSK